jgi:hypothetical protein
MCTGNCNCSCDQITIPSIVGPNGVNGLNAFTTTTAQFIVPAIGANVTLAVSNSNPSTGSWAVPGQSVYIENAGYYTVVSSTTTSIVVTNTGTTGNTAPGTTVASGQQVSPAGVASSQGGRLQFNYFNATAGTGSYQLFGSSYQNINYTDYALAQDGDEVNVTGFIFTGASISTDTYFKFRLDGAALLTTPKITYSPITRVTFEIKIIRVTNTTIVFMAKQYNGELIQPVGQATVFDWSSIGTISVADLDNPGNYPLSVDFQVNSDVAATLGWQSIQSIK